MDQARILVVEDDPVMADLVRSVLEEAGFTVLGAASGREGLSLALTGNPDLAILDIRLPGLDGLSLCREIRRSSHMPVLILSQQAHEVDKVVGLEVGADDYLAKPFQARELVARVRALLRRWLHWQPRQDEQARLVRGVLSLDLRAHTANVGQEKLPLTGLEFCILKHLMQSPGQVLTRQQLIDHAWGADFVGDERTVDVHIRNLRAKIRKLTPEELILSVRGVGYKLAQ